MQKTYTTKHRLLGFGCAIAILILLGACGKQVENRSAADTLGTATEAPASAAPDTAPASPAESAAPASAPAGEKKDGLASPAAEGLEAGSIRKDSSVVRDDSYSSSFYAEAPYDGGYEYEPVAPVPGSYEPAEGEPFVLTAAEWNDNSNWPFFSNLVSAGTISFPVFGIDPRNRIQVTVTDEAGAVLPAEAVVLWNAEGEKLWSAVTDKAGVAYLFFSQEETPDHVTAAGAEQPVYVSVPDESGQGTASTQRLQEITVVGSAQAARPANLQVMFIVDTTGSMGDELAYLQKDFSAIAEKVGNAGVSYSVCFYRDEGDDYVTKCSGFTSDISAVQALINAEYAEGGGDIPEAVAQVLTECLTERSDWDESCAKLAFLIFDAPPHSGTDAVLDRAVRAAAARGIHVVPVVASNAERETELFGRALAICTNGTYIFLTDDSGVGDSHLEPIVGSYTVEKLHDIIVRLIGEYRP